MEHKKGAYFISGVDTDCGKTYVTARLAAYLRHRGVSVITQKPIQTGCQVVADDLVEHRKIMGCGMLPEDREERTCTYLFKKPASPHYAAALEGVLIDPERITADTNYLLSRYDVVLVEGAGGLLVPLTKDLLTIDYVAAAGLPLILVATSKVGGINHALLSLEACKSRGVDVTTLVYNRLPQNDSALADDSFNVIANYTAKMFPKAVTIDFRSSDSFWGKI